MYQNKYYDGGKHMEKNKEYTTYNEKDDQTDCSRQSAYCNGYADLPLGCVCEGTEIRNSADENVKIYKIKRSR